MPFLARCLNRRALMLNSPIHTNLRTFSVSAFNNFKDISIKEENNKITVEGVNVPSPRTKYLLKCEQGGGKANCHPFCKSSIAPKVSYII